MPSSKRDFQKQEFKEILNQISILETKVETLLNDKIDIHQVQYLQKEINELHTLTSKYDKNVFFNGNNNIENTLGKDLGGKYTDDFKNASKTHVKSKSSFNNRTKVNEIDSETHSSKSLYMLADAVTSRSESPERTNKRHIDEIDDTEQDGTYKNFKSSLDDRESGVTYDSFDKTNELYNDPDTMYRFIDNSEMRLENIWSNIRNVLPLNFQIDFELLDLKVIQENTKKQDLVNKIIDSPQLGTIPPLYIMTEIVNIFIKKLKLHIVVPIKDYDLFGILQIWKAKGFESLNNSHLLLLNLSGLMTCKSLQLILESKTIETVENENDDDGLNDEFKIDYKNTCDFKVYNKELGDEQWLRRHEDIFFSNCLIYFQSISLFPNGLASVQGILSLLIFSPIIGINLSKSLMLSTAVRIAQDLGLHSQSFLDAINLNNDRLKEKKKEVWWFCCFIDEILSRRSMRPCMIMKYNSTVLFNSQDRTKLLDLHSNLSNDKDLNKSTKTDYDNELIQYIYEKDGIYPIFKYYNFKLFDILFKYSKYSEKCFDLKNFEKLNDEIYEFFENLPSIIKNDDEINKTFNDAESGQEIDPKFIYLIHILLMEIQNQCSQVLNDLNNETYIVFLKTQLELISKLKTFKTFSVCLELEFLYFEHFLKIIEFNMLYQTDYNKYKADCLYLTNYVNTMFNIDADDKQQQEQQDDNDNDDCNVSVKGEWRREKYFLIKNLLNIFKSFGEYKHEQKRETL